MTMVMATFNLSDPSLLDLHIVAIAVQTNSLYASSLMNGDIDSYWGVGGAVDSVGPQTYSHASGKDSTPPDCGSKSKSRPHSDDKSDSQGNSPYDGGATAVTGTTATPTNTGPGPAIARRHFRSRMRRDSKASPSILERDDPATVASKNPITVEDLLDHLIGQRAASRKRAERPRTSRGVY